MEMTSVESSNLAAVAYDAATKLLTIRFRSGAVWDYAAVPAETHAALMASESKGRYFAQHIKPVYAAMQRTRHEEIVTH